MLYHRVDNKTYILKIAYGYNPKYFKVTADGIQKDSSEKSHALQYKWSKLDFNDCPIIIKQYQEQLEQKLHLSDGFAENLSADEKEKLSVKCHRLKNKFEVPWFIATTVCNYPESDAILMIDNIKAKRCYKKNVEVDFSSSFDCLIKLEECFGKSFLEMLNLSTESSICRFTKWMFPKVTAEKDKK